MGGEKQLPFHFFCVLGGSPPRGRGKALHLVPSSKQHRITPAWAGKSAAVDAAAAAARDHPRVGGEKTMRFIIASTVSGSPPRGRGKAFQTPCPGWRERITPAWAGKSRVKQNQIAFWWDHPRVGGEKAARPGQVGRQPGITPAWAGKRLKRSHRSGIFISGPIPFHSVLHRPAGSGGSRAGRDGSPAGQPQNTGPA